MQPRDLEKYNIVWNSPSQSALESMPCGGGDIGLNVWVENGDLLIYLAQSGTFDELNTMPKLGRLRVQISPNPFAAGATFRQELKLHEGFVEITAASASLQVKIEIWVEVFRPVVHVEIESNQPTQSRVTYENWRPEDREFKGAETHSARSWSGCPEKGIARKDTVQFTGNSVTFIHRNSGRNAFDLVVEQQSLGAIKDRLWNPLANRTFGGVLWGEGFADAGTSSGKYASTEFKGWSLQGISPARSHKLFAAMHVAQTETLDQWQRELDRIVEAAKTDPAAKARTRSWWKDFWERSYILVDAEKPDPALPRWQIGRNYQVFRYQLGCNAFGEFPTKFNGGLFTTDPEFVDPKRNYNPDFRQWGGGSFTAQNQRLLYWPMLKSGDIDLMKPQFEFYRRALVNAQARSEHYWNISGASFTEQIENFGLPVGYEYGWKRNPDVDKGIEDNAWVNHQWDTVFEFCQMILDSYVFAGADIQDYIPLIESCLRFYDEFYQMRTQQRTGKPLGDDGKLVLFPGTALETYKNALNATPTIAALQGVLKSLLALPAEYQSKMDVSRWKTMALRIPSIALREKEGHQSISPAWEWTHKQNCELPQLYPVYPWGMYGIGRPDLQVAVDTWKYGYEAPDQKQIISWHQDPIFCARLGLTDEAGQLTIEKLKDAPRRFPTYWGPGHDWVPDHNWGGSGMIALQEMLMQCVDEKIYLLPAWPRDWVVKFKLHAPRNTTVELQYTRGRVEFTITPSSRRSDVILPDGL